jgi:DNA primase large subunit
VHTVSNVHRADVYQAGKYSFSDSVCVSWCVSPPPPPPCSKANRVMFYKVPFSAVPDLVARRQVLLHDGFAYVREAQVSCLWAHAAGYGSMLLAVGRS